MTKVIDYSYDYNLAKMAGASYHSPASIETSMQSDNEDDRLLPDDWKILPNSFEDTNANTGFVAIAFENSKTREIVIAYRGSEPTGPTAHGLIDYKGANVAIAQDGDMRGVTDNLALRAGGQRLARRHAPDWHAQFEQGLNYAEKILERSQTMPGGPYTVHVTGHSLGGAIAQVTHEMFDLPGRTFDPGGAQNLVQSHEFKAWRSEYCSSRDDGLRRADRDPEGRGFSNYLVNDSLVSRYSGPHVGRIEDVTDHGGRETMRDKAPYRVKHTVDGAVGAIGGAFDVIELHDMDRIIRVFKDAQQTGELNRLSDLTPESTPQHALQQTLLAQQAQQHQAEREQDRHAQDHPDQVAAREPARPQPPAQLRPFSDPDHPQHVLYTDAKTRFPDLSEARLHQVTAEMHKIGMQLGRNSDAIERNGIVWGSRSDVPGLRFGIDLSSPEPSVQQTMQDVRQHDAEQQRIAQSRQEEMARSQSGPVMG